MRLIGSGTPLIERDEWGARPSLGTTWITPTEGVTGHWEGNGIGWPWEHDTCYSLVRGIQAFHMDGRGWADIAYNALACPHGWVFEGRGANVRSAAHGEPGNSLSYAICFLSGIGDPFTPEQARAWSDGVAWLMDDGGASGALHCHRDWMSTACPGDDRCSWIKAGAIPPVPTPPEEPEMPTAPAYAYDTNGTLWVAALGADKKTVYVKRIGIDPDFAPLTGVSSSAPTLAPGPNGAMTVGARGANGAAWRNMFTPKAKPEWSGWLSDGGQLA